MRGHLRAELQITGAQRDRLERDGGPTAVSGAPPASLSQPAAGTAPWGLSSQSHTTFPNPGAASPRSRGWQGWSQPESSPRQMDSHLPAASPRDLALCLWGRETESETEKEGDGDRDTETEIQRQTETWRDRE